MPECRSCGGRLIEIGPVPAAPGETSNAAPMATRLYRCTSCLLGLREPLPPLRALVEEYAAAPADTMDYDPARNAAWSLAKASLLQRFSADQPISVLDVGCHTGGFLGSLPGAWRRFGIESSQQAIEVARTRHAVQIIGGRLEEGDPKASAQFDVVTLFDVVEHLDDPARGIELALRFLRPGGWLCLSSADMDAWTWRWLGAHHWYLQTSQHLSVVSRSHLRRLSRVRGVQVRKLVRIPHRLAGRAQRLFDGTRLIYWGMRTRRGAYRVPHRLIQSLPGLRDLRHMRAAPWAMTLKDHLFAIYEQPRS